MGGRKLFGRHLHPVVDLRACLTIQLNFLQRQYFPGNK